MSLTARTLHLGVPIVAAFHVVRMVALAIGPVHRLGLRLARRRRSIRAIEPFHSTNTEHAIA
jgi:uncharacterized membrane protein AbrB (regulator of aidB expression)